MAMTLTGYTTDIECTLPVDSGTYTADQFSTEITYTDAVNQVLITTVYTNPAAVTIVQPTVSVEGSVTITGVPVYDGSNRIETKYYNNIDFNAATEITSIAVSGTFTREYTV